MFGYIRPTTKSHGIVCMSDTFHIKYSQTVHTFDLTEGDIRHKTA